MEAHSCMTKQQERLLHLKGSKLSAGFTLSEVVIVLLIWSTLLMVLIPFHSGTIQTIQTSLFMNQLKEDVLITQQLTMKDHTYYTLVFRTDRNEYLVYDQKNKKPVLRRELPASWKLQLLTIEPVLRFNQYGIITKPGTMKIHTAQTIYKLTFPFGASRFTIEEL